MSSTSLSIPATPPTSPPISPHLRYPSTRDISQAISLRFLNAKEFINKSQAPVNSSSSSSSDEKSKKKENNPSRSHLKTEHTNDDLIVKALNWPDYENNYKNCVDLIPGPLCFPVDDISVEIWPKPHRVLWNLAPSPFESGIDPATRNSISILFSDYTTVNHKYKNFRLGKAKNWRQTAAHGSLLNAPPTANGVNQSGANPFSPRLSNPWDADASISHISPPTRVRTTTTADLSHLFIPTPLMLDDENSEEAENKLEATNKQSMMKQSQEIIGKSDSEFPKSNSEPNGIPDGASTNNTSVNNSASSSFSNNINASVGNSASSSFSSNRSSVNYSAGVNASGAYSGVDFYNKSSSSMFGSLRLSGEGIFNSGSLPAPLRRGTAGDGSEVRRAAESDDVRNLSGEIRSNLLMKPFPQFSTIDILVESVDCKLSLEVEPLFCTIALYDIEKQVKISENFHFQLNGELMTDHMKNVFGKFSRRCVFSTPVHGKIYYLVRVCNLFRGVSGKDSSSIYLKTKSSQNVDSFKKDLREKLTSYSTLQGTPFVQFPRQHLAWAAFPVFAKGPSGWSLRGEEAPLTCDTFFLYKTNQTDTEICTILSSDKEMRKNKSAFGVLRMKVRPVLGELSRYADVVISPSGVPVVPCTKLESVPKSEYVREIEQFIPAPTPNTEFVNNMYIYPEYVHLRSKTNLQIMVQVVDSIDKYPWPILRTAYPPGGILDFTSDSNDMGKQTPVLDLCDVSAINFRCETPYFYDEFKLKIPLNLKHHCLLFTFYHVNPSSKKEFRTVFGYAAIPLFNSENKILRDGTYTLAISSTTKNIDTIPRTSDDNLSKLSYIRFRTRLASTVFTQDECLANLFENVTTSTISIVSYESIRSLQRADKVDCVRFFPVVAAHIFRVLCDNHNCVEGGTYAGTGLNYKELGSPRNRAMSDGASNPAPHNVHLIPRSHSEQAGGHNALSQPRLSSNSSAPTFASNSAPSSAGSTPMLTPRSDFSLSQHDYYSQPNAVTRERAGSFSGESTDEPASNLPQRSATIGPTILQTIIESNEIPPISLPPASPGSLTTKKKMKSKIKINIPPHSDSAPNLHEHAALPFSPMFSNRHSFATLPSNPLKQSTSNILPPNGSHMGQESALQNPEVVISEVPQDPNSEAPTLSAGLSSGSISAPVSPMKGSTSTGIGSSSMKSRFQRFSLSPSQIRKIQPDENAEDGGENSVRYRKHMKAADFGITHAEIASEAFFALLNLLQVVDGTSSKFMEKSDEASPILAHYVHFIFDNPHVYEPLAHYWKLALVEKHPSMQGFKLNWVFFSIIAKSMAMKLHSNGLYGNDFNRSARFQNKFHTNLRALVPFFVPNIQTQRGYDSFTEFPLFVNDLFPLMDRGVILDLVHTYISSIDKNEDIFRVTAVFSFLKTICDYEHFLPLNIPVATETIDSVIDLNAKFWQKHFLIGILLSEVDNCFKKTVAARTQALSTLKALVRKHEIDPRYQEAKTRQHISCMYFPFVLMVVERFDSVMKFDVTEKTDIFRVLLWIISNLSPTLLRSWFVRDTQRRQAGFLSLIEVSIDLLGSAYGDTICDIIEYLIADCSDDLATQTPLLEAILSLTAKSLSLTTNLYTFCRVVGLVESLVKVAHTPFYVQNNNMCEVICYELFPVTNHPNENIRSRASKLVFFLMQKNLEETTNISRTKAQATIAISRLVGEGKLQDFTGFHTSMNELIEWEKALRGDGSGDGKKGVVEETAIRILNLVKDTAKLASTTDSESVAEIYYRISIGYSDTPNMRLTWLDNLAKHHRECKRWDEAAQSHLLSAHLIAQYHFALSPSNPPLHPALFQTVCPNSDKELPLGPIQQNQFQEALWSIKSLVAQLDSATKHFSTAGHLELTLETLTLISAVYKTQRSYVNMAQILERSKMMCETIMQKEKIREPRTTYRFYRIGFYGSAFEENDGVEFIYKMPAEYHLATMQTAIKEQLQQKSAKHDVILLTNAEISRTSLDSTKSYYQVISVEPYFEPSEMHLSLFGPYFNCKRFIAEVALNFEGKMAQEGDLARQQKRKTIFTTETRFTYYSNRIPVQGKHDIILTPLENAIEQIMGRTAMIRAQLESSPPRINPLQQIIQGSVLPMVNEGPLKICETFLTKPEMFNQTHIDQLRQSLLEFVKMCGFAIALNKSLIGPQHIKFQKMVEEQYKSLKEKVTKYTSATTSTSTSTSTTPPLAAITTSFTGLIPLRTLDEEPTPGA